MDEQNYRWAEWNRRVVVLAALQIAAFVALGLFVTFHGPTGETGSWDELAGVLVATPIIAAVWPIRLSEAEWRGFVLPQVGFLLLAWMAIELI